LIKADTKVDTKRYDFDASVDSIALEIIANSSRVGWCGCPFTPATPVQIRLGTPAHLSKSSFLLGGGLFLLSKLEGGFKFNKKLDKLFVLYYLSNNLYT
jgi:hypothetical protein